MSIGNRLSLAVQRSTHAFESDAVATAIVVGIATIPILLFPFFSSQSLRLDEAQSLWQTSRSTLSILSIIAGDVHVPLYHLLLHAWRLYVGDGVLVARVMSLTFFVLSVPAVYALASLAYSRRVALFASLLFAISPFMNWYASEIRMYTLFVFFIVINQYLFMRIFKNSDAGNGVWVLYVATAALGMYIHYFFALSLLSQAVFYGLRRDMFAEGSLKRFCVSAAVVLAAVLPWAWYVYHTGTAGFQDPTLQVPSSVNLFSAFSEFMFGFQNDWLNTILLSLWPLVIVLWLFTLSRNRRLVPETQYFIITILISFALTFIASYIVAPLFVSRYLIFTIPALYLIIGNLLSNYSPRMRYATQGALLTLMVFTLAIEIWSPSTPVKENYAQATAYLSANATAQDTILISAPFTIYPVEYYYRGPAAISTLPAWDRYSYGPIPDFDPDKLPAEIAAATAGSQRVFLLLSYDQGYEEQIQTYFDTHYQRLYAGNYSKDLNLYVYRLRYNTDRSAIRTSLAP